MSEVEFKSEGKGIRKEIGKFSRNVNRTRKSRKTNIEIKRKSISLFVDVKRHCKMLPVNESTSVSRCLSVALSERGQEILKQILTEADILELYQLSVKEFAEAATVETLENITNMQPIFIEVFKEMVRVAGLQETFNRHFTTLEIKELV